MPGSVIQATFPQAAAIQRQGNGHAFQLPPRFHLGRGAGQPMPQPIRQKMEKALGADFSDVRIHVGQEAASIGALAFTHGANIYFAAGQYNPDSAHGQKILGHELAHVVQQRAGRVRNPFGSGIAVVQDRALEAEADRIASRAAAPMPVPRMPARPTSADISRRPAAHAARGRQTVQRLVKIRDGMSVNRLAWRLAFSARLYNWPRILGNSIDQEQRILKANLEEMMAGPENWGTFDVDDDQHVGLLYFEVLSFIKNFVMAPSSSFAALETHRQAMKRPRQKPAVYELAFIGAGSTTAYYIDTLGPDYDHSATLLFGETGKNPWAGERGFSIDFINHVRRQIDLPSRNVTDAPHGASRTTEMFVKRKHFAAQAAAVIIAAAIPDDQCIKDPIEPNGISREKDTNIYQIKTRGETYKVRKVVFAAGAGGHKEPIYKGGKTYEMDVPQNLRGSKVIDMDKFIREIVAEQKGKVIVVGPNAAIDAVAAARKCEWDVVWFCGAPAFLPGTLYMEKPYELQKIKPIDAVHVDVEDAAGKLKVYYCEQKRNDPGKHLRGDECRRPKSEKKSIEAVDFVVYGIGPAGTVGSLLAQQLIDELTPVYDETFKFAPGAHAMLSKDLADYVAKREKNLVAKDDDKEKALVAWAEKSWAGKPFLGLKTKDKGLFVIGAAAEAHKVPAEQIGSGPGSVKASLSSDVLTHGQLTYIRAAVMAHNQFIPPSAGQRVDFSHANADILRAHLSAKYSDIGDEKLDPGDTIATRLIKIIMTLARDRRIPHGYTREQEQIITDNLGLLDASFQARRPLVLMQTRVTEFGNTLIQSIGRTNVNPTYMAWLTTNQSEYAAFKKEQDDKREALGLGEKGFL